MTTVYFAGGEDSEHFGAGGTTSIVTTSTWRRTLFSRCALASQVAGAFWKNIHPWNASNFWFGAQLYQDAITGANAGQVGLAFEDSSGITRLQMTTVSAGVFRIDKVNAAGTVTQLGSNFSIPFIVGIQKFDVRVNYAVSGAFEIYVGGNNTAVFAYSGDVTTDSVTALAFHRLGSFYGSNDAGWSEIMILDRDTRALNLQTFPPVANGNTHNFDTGTPAASNVNEVTLDVTVLDGSTTAGQIDEYTNGAVAAGTYGVLAFGVSAILARGSSGPSKADLAVRTGGTDYFSADQSLTLNWDNYQNWWAQNPGTSADWLTTEIGATSGFNIGIKSVT